MASAASWSSSPGRLCALVRAALVTDDVHTLADAQHAYISAGLSMFVRLGVSKAVESSLAEAAWAEIRSPEVGPVLRELHDLGGRLSAHRATRSTSSFPTEEGLTPCLSTGFSCSSPMSIT